MININTSKSRGIYIKFFLAIIFFLSGHFSNAQEIVEKITSVFEHEIGHPKDTNHYHTKFVLAPIISYEPSTSLGVGVGAKLLFKFPKSYEETRTSNIPIAARYTLNKQFIFSTDFTVFTNQEKWMFKGMVSLLKFPFLYYGIGSDTKEEDQVELSYNQFLFEPLILKKIKGYLFMGGGLRYNSIYNTYEYSELGDEGTKISRQDSLGVRALGFEIALSYDSRDNILNASEGYFVEYTLGTYDKSWGSSNSFNLSKLNARTYKKVWENRPDVIAFEFYSRFSWGDVPLLEYSTLGGHELLRGVSEGRYRDRHAVYFQTEYRWQALDRIGFVFFTGTGDVFSDANELSTKNLKVNVGTGLRLKIVKAENLNIRLDYGFVTGNEFDHNFYLSIAEAF